MLLSRLGVLYAKGANAPAAAPTAPGTTVHGALTQRTCAARPQTVDSATVRSKLPRAYNQSTELLNRARSRIEQQREARLDQATVRQVEELRVMYMDIAAHPDRGPQTSSLDAAFWARLHRLEYVLGLELTPPPRRQVTTHDNNAPLGPGPTEPSAGTAPVDGAAPGRDAPEARGYRGGGKLPSLGSEARRRRQETSAQSSERTMRERAAAYASMAKRASLDVYRPEPVTAPDHCTVRMARQEFAKRRSAQRQ